MYIKICPQPGLPAPLQRNILQTPIPFPFSPLDNEPARRVYADEHPERREGGAAGARNSPWPRLPAPGARIAPLARAHGPGITIRRGFSGAEFFRTSWPSHNRQRPLCADTVRLICIRMKSVSLGSKLAKRVNKTRAASLPLAIHRSDDLYGPRRTHECLSSGPPGQLCSMDVLDSPRTLGSRITLLIALVLLRRDPSPTFSGCSLSPSLYMYLSLRLSFSLSLSLVQACFFYSLLSFLSFRS